MIGRLRAFWREREARERRFVAGALLVLLVFAYAWLLIGVGKARNELSVSLVSLRNEAAAVERDAGEIDSLRQRVGAKTSAVDLRALAQAQAAAAGLTRALQRADAPAANQLQVGFAAAGFSDWLNWLKGMQAQQLRVESCRVEALPTAGLVNITASLTRAQQQ